MNLAKVKDRFPWCQKQKQRLVKQDSQSSFVSNSNVCWQSNLERICEYIFDDMSLGKCRCKLIFIFVFEYIPFQNLTLFRTPLLLPKSAVYSQCHRSTQLQRTPQMRPHLQIHHILPLLRPLLLLLHKQAKDMGLSHWWKASHLPAHQLVSDHRLVHLQRRRRRQLWMGLCRPCRSWLQRRNRS